MTKTFLDGLADRTCFTSEMGLSVSNRSGSTYQTTSDHCVTNDHRCEMGVGSIKEHKPKSVHMIQQISHNLTLNTSIREVRQKSYSTHAKVHTTNKKKKSGVGSVETNRRNNIKTLLDFFSRADFGAVQNECDNVGELLQGDDDCLTSMNQKIIIQTSKELVAEHLRKILNTSDGLKQQKQSVTVPIPSSEVISELFASKVPGGDKSTLNEAPTGPLTQEQVSQGGSNIGGSRCKAITIQKPKVRYDLQTKISTTPYEKCKTKLSKRENHPLETMFTERYKKDENVLTYLSQSKDNTSMISILAQVNLPLKIAQIFGTP